MLHYGDSENMPELLKEWIFAYWTMEPSPKFSHWKGLADIAEIDVEAYKSEQIASENSEVSQQQRATASSNNPESTTKQRKRKRLDNTLTKQDYMFATLQRFLDTMYMHANLQHLIEERPHHPVVSTLVTPSELTCGISTIPLLFPVRASDGHLYNKPFLDKLFQLAQEQQRSVESPRVPGTYLDVAVQVEDSESNEVMNKSFKYLMSMMGRFKVLQYITELEKKYDQ